MRIPDKALLRLGRLSGRLFLKRLRLGLKMDAGNGRSANLEARDSLLDMGEHGGRGQDRDRDQNQKRRVEVASAYDACQVTSASLTNCTENKSFGSPFKAIDQHLQKEAQSFQKTQLCRSKSKSLQSISVYEEQVVSTKLLEKNQESEVVKEVEAEPGQEHWFFRTVRYLFGQEARHRRHKDKLDGIRKTYYTRRHSIGI